MSERFVRPSRLDGVFNAVVGRLTRLGLPLAGSRVLAVRGRSSGEWRTTPVNPLRVDGDRYLVAPRGNAQWVRNLRAAGEGELRHGRSVERFRAQEIPDAEKPPILRAYLQAWAWEVGRFFEGVDKNSPDERLADIAPGFPVFRIRPGGRS
ncbi:MULTISPECIES: nitroreductase family deazaflavin-dependent oxidoreductase [Microbacterium]|uniref:nitroreductase family deazaflavin-dependent oxidoreductase n=1 Tax=Microbacterium TaxID=33882 RepID=UPI002783B283|nr:MULTISPECIES: nitroreductase family deazaflavin-dependent oxidoreductase [Microbacterium]MDQ1083053.1 deazaflavin-dependent oxidoreductase (nitroreductase family) [Microbacterium sp. SORGH_AS_0344]MDQ1171676.1 deazaflavin-dependent oxidoreductase (nitroreductase family) [Microbacterium proteolyticum]